MAIFTNQPGKYQLGYTQIQEFITEPDI